jgi:prepilin-type processing-associated H-X9-DG protein
LALAVNSFETATKHYPPAGIVGPRIMDIWKGPMNPRSGNMLSWIVLVLPYMDEQALYQQFDLSQSVINQTGDPQAAPLAALYCPSDASQGRFYSDPAIVEGNLKLTEGKHFAKGNYAAFNSPEHTTYGDLWPSGLSGVHRYRRKDVTDGTATTLLLSEVRTRETPLDQRGAWALPWTGSTLLSFDMHAAKWDTHTFQPELLSSLTAELLSASDWAYQPASYSLGYTQPPNNQGPNMDMLYRCADAAGAQQEGLPCMTFNATGSTAWLSAAPRSRHPGGVNVAFSDGHIGFLPDTIDEYTMAYLVSATDGQRVDLSAVR